MRRRSGGRSAPLRYGAFADPGIHSLASGSPSPDAALSAGQPGWQSDVGGGRPLRLLRAGWRRVSGADSAHVAGRLRAGGPAPPRLRLWRGTDAAPLPRRGGLGRDLGLRHRCARRSIGWSENLCPPLHALRNEAAPGLPFEDGHFDLVWALSVFTHLADSWAAWMLELHRVLADDGILIATSLGPRHSERIAKERWEDDRIGMNALRQWASYPDGAPVVLHSTWWLRAHWGRAFEILEVDESPPGEPSAGSRCESAMSPSALRIWSVRSPASRAS